MPLCGNALGWAGGLGQGLLGCCAGGAHIAASCALGASIGQPRINTHGRHLEALENEVWKQPCSQQHGGGGNYRGSNPLGDRTQVRSDFARSAKSENSENKSIPRLLIVCTIPG